MKIVVLCSPCYSGCVLFFVVQVEFTLNDDNISKNRMVQLMIEFELRTRELLAILKQELVPLCTVIDLTPHAYGVENCVFRAVTEEWGEVAVKVPWYRKVKNANDGKFNSIDGLVKEYKLTMHCSKHGIPVPLIHKLHKGDKIDFIVQEFIVAESGSSFPYEDMGRVTSLLHEIQDLPDLNPFDAHTIISNRIIERTKTLEKLKWVHLPMPSVEENIAALNSFEPKNRLLHMDIRPANIIMHSSQVKAIFDWTNALIGDPVLELMRIKGYGYLNDDFIKGYRNYFGELSRVPQLVQWLYQYDTTVMLALLFLTEIDAPEQFELTFESLLRLHGSIKNKF